MPVAAPPEVKEAAVTAYLAGQTCKEVAAMDPEDERHGSNAGYLEHIRARVTACQPCRAAHAEARRNLWRKRYLRGVDRLYIDATGTHRRIRALMALGWRFCDIDTLAGYPAERATWAHNLMTQPRVHVDTAEKVAAVYDQLCMSRGPSVRVRNLAAKRGWPTPLAWDDDQIDDPSASPHGAAISTTPPVRERTRDSLDHRACARCGIVREVRTGRGKLCADCREVVAA